jgi:hypothetical protein
VTPAGTAAAVAALGAASALSRPARLDASFRRRRRRDARAAAAAASGGPPPTDARAWFVSADAWIKGTAGGGGGGEGGEAEGGGPLDPSTTAAAIPPPALPTAPADDAQRTCALTGEPFTSFYDEGRGEWRYRDATALSAAAAAALGLAAGRLVKASALECGGDGAAAVAAVAGLAEDATLASDLAAAVADGSQPPAAKRIKAEK